MDKICLIDQNYNMCPFIRDNQICKKNGSCNMQVKVKEDTQPQYHYRREPRWYEKYYKINHRS